MLELWKILVLAVVQGFTEFLPISSSGHLVVLSSLMTPGDPSQLEISDLSVVLHMGTLLSIVVFFWRRIWALLAEDRRVIRLLIVGTIPAVVIGLTIELTCKHLLESPLLAGLMLPVTGLILLWADRASSGVGRYADLDDRQSLLIGLSQAFAILPGISRSGSTISAGLRLGLSPTDAATFSFLLAIPAIGGAGLLKGLEAAKDGLATPWPHLLAGGVTSFVIGLVALFWLIQWLQRGRLRLFAWWCIPLGIAVTIWQVWLLVQPASGL